MRTGVSRLTDRELALLERSALFGFRQRREADSLVDCAVERMVVKKELQG